MTKNFLLLASVSTISVGFGAADINETQAQSVKRSHSGVEHEDSRLAEKRSRVSTAPLNLPNQAATAPESCPVAVKSSRATPEKPDAGESPQAALDLQGAEFRERITFVDLTYQICLDGLLEPTKSSSDVLPILVGVTLRSLS